MKKKSTTKRVHSNDPRKPRIVAALKKASKCRKVTNVREYPEYGTFEGDCMWPEEGTRDAEEWAATRMIVKAEECGFKPRGGNESGL